MQKHNKHVRTLLMALLAWAISACSNNENTVDSFNTFLQKNAKSAETSSEVYLNPYNNMWAKRKYAIQKIEFDLKKTDSIVNPIIGIAEIVFSSMQTELFESEAEAQKSFSFQEPIIFSAKLNFNIDKGIWRMTNGTYYSLPDSHQSSISPEEIAVELDTIPAAFLKFWL